MVLIISLVQQAFPAVDAVNYSKRYFMLPGAGRKHSPFFSPFRPVIISALLFVSKFQAVFILFYEDKLRRKSYLWACIFHTH